jgi:hypothetical protein
MQQQQTMRRSYHFGNAQGPTSFDSVTSSIKAISFTYMLPSSRCSNSGHLPQERFFWQISAAQPILGDYFVCGRRNVKSGRWSALLASSHAGLFRENSTGDSRQSQDTCATDVAVE